MQPLVLNDGFVSCVVGSKRTMAFFSKAASIDRTVAALEYAIRFGSGAEPFDLCVELSVRKRYVM